MIIAINKDTNKTIGSIATLFFPSIDDSEPLAMIGMFFVLPEFRGIGLGAKLWNLAFHDPQFDGINFGLLGVDRMHKKYANKYGFNKYMNSIFKEYMAEIKDVVPSKLKADEKIKIITPEKIDPQKLIEFDTKMIGGGKIRRDKFILNFFKSKNTFSKIAMDLEGRIVGIGGIRIVYNKQIAIGPLYANSIEIAETLLKNILESIPNLMNEYTNIFMFPTAINENAKDLFKKLTNGKFKINEDFHGQFTKNTIQPDASKLYSVTEYIMSYC